MRVGSPSHRDLFCGHFIQSHQRFQPEDLPWPDLDPVAAARLRGVPFWQEVLHTEQRVIAIIEAFSRTVADPLVREAVDLMGLRGAPPRAAGPGARGALRDRHRPAAPGPADRPGRAAVH